MNAWTFLKPSTLNDVPAGSFVVVHPLDDVAEKKLDTSALGPMSMTTSVKLSLFALRGYLVLMTFLLAYHLLDLAGMFAAR